MVVNFFSVDALLHGLVSRVVPENKLQDQVSIKFICNAIYRMN